jgi:L-ascorbate metabolism protein UlaG (beta-lactamase superfamily)
VSRLPSDHFDGKRFFNPALDDTPPDRRSLGKVLRWQMGRGQVAWGPQPALPRYPAPPTSVLPGSAAITFIGHASFLIRFADFTMLTDPVFSERCSPVSWAGPRRAHPPGLALADLPPIDLVLVSHNHYDHMDLPSLRWLAANNSGRVVTSAGNDVRLRAAGFATVDALDWWEAVEFGPTRITATPARHFARRGLFDGNATLWSGFSLQRPDGHLLFAGDSATGPHWRVIQERLGPPDLALLPIGAYEPRWLMAAVHMNPEEAALAHRDLGARQSVGMHFGTFQLTDEPISAPVRALNATGVEGFTTLGIGETRVFSLRP